MKHLLSDEDLLGGGAEDLLNDTPAPKKSKKSSAKKAAAAKPKKAPASDAKSSKKAPAAKKAAKPAKAAPAPKAKREKKERKPGSNVKPTLSNSRIAILAFFSAADNKWTTREEVAKGVLGKAKAVGDALKTFIGSEIVPMVKSGILEFDKATDTIRPNPEKYNVRSKSLLSFIKHVPQDAAKGVSAGVLGGKVWGTKDEQWVNVRYGRAAGALLKNLAAVGAVGHTQEHAEATKLWYRLPVNS